MSAAAKDGPCTYFLMSGGDPLLVKIGTTGKIRKRMKKYRTLNPFIRVLGISRSITEDEAHQLFASSRCGTSEWFMDVTGITEYLARNLTVEEKKETALWNTKIARYREKEGLP